MAMNFGKGNRSIAFNPTSAFPLDARSYFESYSDAVAAAASAEAAGSTNTQYYYGQTLVVVENNKATFYIIQPDNTLSTLTSGSGSSGDGESTTLTVDANQFDFDDTGALILRGSKGASANSLVSIDVNGVLQWIDPIDTYTKTEIDEKIAAAAHLSRKIVGSVDEINQYIAENDDADLYIFMVPTGLEEDSDRYDEYMVISVTDADGIVTQYPEKVGSWEVDLKDYAKTTDVETALATKVDAEEGSRLITEEEAEKLSNIEDGAQVNIIESVSDDFSIVTDIDNGLVKQLQLNQLAMSKITGLTSALDSKVNAQDGYTLLSPSDKEKLDALVLGDSGNVEISGTVNAANVQGLEDWITERAGTLEGLSENNFSDAYVTKLNGMLYISSVNTDQLQVKAGKLSIIGVEQSLVNGLTDALNAKASAADMTAAQADISTLQTNMTNVQSAITTVNSRISSIQTTLNQHTSEIAELQEALTWKDI